MSALRNFIRIGALVLILSSIALAQKPPTAAPPQAQGTGKPECSGIGVPRKTDRPAATANQQLAQASAPVAPLTKESEALCKRFRDECGKDHPACAKS